MHISTTLLPAAIKADQPIPQVAVIIDVLRATSVATTAAAMGTESIITCREVADALDLADQMEPRPLLCGERGCQPIDGFDLGNSPAEYDAGTVGGRGLILTTTNGTRAIEMSTAERMILGSFLNLSAVVEVVVQHDSAQLACAGTEGEVTAEDVLLAGAIIDGCLATNQKVTMDDASTLSLQLWRSWFPESHRSPSCDELTLRLRESQGGRNLVRLGYAADLERCARIDRYDVVLERQQIDPNRFILLSKP